MAKFTLIDEADAGAPTGPQETPKFVLMDEADPTGSFAQNALAGVGKTLTDVTRGAGQRVREFVGPNSSVRALAEAQGVKVQNPIADRLGLPTEADEAAARELDAPLMATAGGKLGAVGGHVALAAPAMALPGANTYTGAGALGSLMGWLQPTVQGESSAANAAVGTTAGGVGKFIGDKIAGGVRGLMNWATTRGTQQASQNTARDAALAAGQAEGAVVSPSQANPSAWNRLLETLSGKVQTAQHTSAKNQEQFVNRMAKEALGLPADQPITPQALKALRDQAGQAYDAVATGQFVTDATFKKQIGALADSQRIIAKQFPEVADDALLKTAASLENAGQLDGRTLIELSRALRDKATMAYQAGDKGVGKFYKSAASELEDLIERNLMYTGSGGRQMLDAFQQARQLIAKTYTVEGALVGSNVNAASLAAQLKRGKPLSGELRTVAEFATEFPKAVQVPQKMGSVLPGSPLDWAVAGGLSAYQGDPNMMLLGLARPAARSVLLSRPYQATMTSPSYGPGGAMRMLSSMVDNEAFRRLAPAAGASVALTE